MMAYNLDLSGKKINFEEVYKTTSDWVSFTDSFDISKLDVPYSNNLMLADNANQLSSNYGVLFYDQIPLSFTTNNQSKSSDNIILYINQHTPNSTKSFILKLQKSNFGANIQQLHYLQLYNLEKNLMVHFTDADNSKVKSIGCQLVIDIKAPSLTIANCKELSGLTGANIARFKIFDAEPGVQDDLYLVSYLQFDGSFTRCQVNTQNYGVYSCKRLKTVAFLSNNRNEKVQNWEIASFERATWTSKSDIKKELSAAQKPLYNIMFTKKNGQFTQGCFIHSIDFETDTLQLELSSILGNGLQFDTFIAQFDQTQYFLSQKNILQTRLDFKPSQLENTSIADDKVTTLSINFFDASSGKLNPIQIQMKVFDDLTSAQSINPTLSPIPGRFTGQWIDTEIETDNKLGLIGNNLSLKYQLQDKTQYYSDFRNKYSVKYTQSSNLNLQKKRKLLTVGNGTVGLHRAHIKDYKGGIAEYIVSDTQTDLRFIECDLKIIKKEVQNGKLVNNPELTPSCTLDSSKVYSIAKGEIFLKNNIYAPILGHYVALVVAPQQLKVLIFSKLNKTLTLTIPLEDGFKTANFLYNSEKKMSWVTISYSNKVNIQEISLAQKGNSVQLVTEITEPDTQFCPHDILQAPFSPTETNLAIFGVISNCSSTTGTVRKIYSYSIDPTNTKVIKNGVTIVDHIDYPPQYELTFCNLGDSYIVFNKENSQDWVYRFPKSGGSGTKAFDHFYWGIDQGFGIQCVYQTDTLLVLGKNVKTGQKIVTIFNANTEYEARNRVKFALQADISWYSGYFGGVFDAIDYSEYFFLVKNTAQQLDLYAQKLTQPKIYFYQENDDSGKLVEPLFLSIISTSTANQKTFIQQANQPVALLNVLTNAKPFGSIEDTNIVSKGQYKLDDRKLKGPVYSLSVKSSDKNIKIYPRVEQSKTISYNPTEVSGKIVAGSGLVLYTRDDKTKYADFVLVSKSEKLTILFATSTGQIVRAYNQLTSDIDLTYFRSTTVIKTGCEAALFRVPSKKSYLKIVGYDFSLPDRAAFEQNITVNSQDEKFKYWVGSGQSLITVVSLTNGNATKGQAPVINLQTFTYNSAKKFTVGPVSSLANYDYCSVTTLYTKKMYNSAVVCINSLYESSDEIAISIGSASGFTKAQEVTVEDFRLTKFKNIACRMLDEISSISCVAATYGDFLGTFTITTNDDGTSFNVSNVKVYNSVPGYEVGEINMIGEYFFYKGRKIPNGYKDFLNDNQLLFLYKSNLEGYIFSSIELQTTSGLSENNIFIEYTRNGNQDSDFPSVFLINNQPSIEQRMIQKSSIKLEKEKSYSELQSVELSVGGKVNPNQDTIALSDLFFSQGFDPSRYTRTGGIFFWVVVSIISLIMLFLILKFCLQRIQFRKAQKEGGEIDYMDFVKSVNTRFGSSIKSHEINPDQKSFVKTVNDYDDRINQNPKEDNYTAYMKKMAAMVGKLPLRILRMWILIF